MKVCAMFPKISMHPENSVFFTELHKQNSLLTSCTSRFICAIS